MWNRLEEDCSVNVDEFLWVFSFSVLMKFQEENKIFSFFCYAVFDLVFCAGNGNALYCL